VPDALANHVHWGAYPWPAGDVGVLWYGGTGSWHLYGDATGPPAGRVVAQGDTTFNRLINTESINATVTIAAGETSQPFPYNDYQKAAGNAFLPVVTPRQNPGSHWWISGLSPTGFTVNLASPAPAGGVPFSVHLQS
jgi:hypothetical protein